MFIKILGLIGTSNINNIRITNYNNYNYLTNNIIDIVLLNYFSSKRIQIRVNINLLS